jgi:hypothetical protein
MNAFEQGFISGLRKLALDAELSLKIAKEWMPPRQAGTPVAQGSFSPQHGSYLPPQPAPGSAPQQLNTGRSALDAATQTAAYTGTKVPQAASGAGNKPGFLATLGNKWKGMGRGGKAAVVGGGLLAAGLAGYHAFGKDKPKQYYSGYGG